MVKVVAGITNLVGNSPFSLIILWSLINHFGSGIDFVASNFLTKFSSCTEISIFTLSSRQFVSSNRATTFSCSARSAAFERWLDTQRL